MVVILWTWLQGELADPPAASKSFSHLGARGGVAVVQPNAALLTSANELFAVLDPDDATFPSDSNINT